MESKTIRFIKKSQIEGIQLFNQLLMDLFHSIGYDNIRLHAQGAGRWVIARGKHRSKPLRMVAECKSFENKTNRTSLANLANTAAREQAVASETGESVAVYCISLSGFTQSVLADEEKIGGLQSINLLDSVAILRKLEDAGLLVNDLEAVYIAKQVFQFNSRKELPVRRIELLVHDVGYVKVVYFGQQQITHVAFIHADGSLLTDSLVHRVLADDKEVNGVLSKLYCLNARLDEVSQQIADESLMQYRRWLGEECGSIQLDGLPTDSDLGPRKLELERLFVPLNVVFIKDGDEVASKPDDSAPIPIGRLLTKAAHVAILASPGGGKSTLLKRLATAYAFPERRKEIGDNLPAHDWLPLFLRCRELQDKVKLPILSILEDIPARVGMSTEHSGVFHQLMRAALQEGRTLLLVDGLDEISQERDRVVFANNLRSFLSVFPQTAMVVTSREAGFRLVAGTIASVCLYARLATFSERDVRDLCVRWLIEVETDTQSVRQGALKLAEDIWESERIQALAVNPLLLTTLLVVKRWIGELPRNRAALYGVAVQVLVRTWNVEGYEPLDEQETLAQLSYVACAMMEKGIQQISHNALLKLLSDARIELEAELQFVRVSPARFIERVESRSSLLMQTGRIVEDGKLQPVYEFRHLTFQEYCAARGYANEQHPHRNEELTLVELLAPHFADERWREVIPLAVVMAERRATESIVKELIKLSAFEDDGWERRDYPYFKLLLSCILDEVKLTTSTLAAALKVIASYGWIQQLSAPGIAKLKNSKVGSLFSSIVEQSFVNEEESWEHYAVAYGYLQEKFIDYDNIDEVNSLIVEIIDEFSCTDRVRKIKAAIVFMQFCFRTAREVTSTQEIDEYGNFIQYRLKEPSFRLTAIESQQLYDGLNIMLASNDWPTIFAASWALAWGGNGVLHYQPANQITIELLLVNWLNAPKKSVGEFIAWGVANSPLLERDALGNFLVDKTWDDFLLENYETSLHSLREDSLHKAALIIGWYRRSPWTDEELIGKIVDSYNLGNLNAIRHALATQHYAFTMLGSLGDAGKRAVLAQQELIANARQPDITIKSS